MTELMRDSLVRVEQKQKKETRIAVKPIAAVTIL